MLGDDRSPYSTSVQSAGSINGLVTKFAQTLANFFRPMRSQMPVVEIVQIERWIEQCHAEAGRAFNRAMAFTSHKDRVEFLTIAGEWLRLAEEGTKHGIAPVAGLDPGIYTRH